MKITIHHMHGASSRVKQVLLQKHIDCNPLAYKHKLITYYKHVPDADHEQTVDEARRKSFRSSLNLELNIACWISDEVCYQSSSIPNP